jgi:hypothetical protein
MPKGTVTFRTDDDKVTVKLEVGRQPRSVAVGDFNHDGAADLVTANYGDNSISVLLGNGDGTFGKPENYAVGAGPVSIAVADFNKDGNADVAVTNCGGCQYPGAGNSVSILLGRGDGSFGKHKDYTTGAGPKSVAAGDFNGDGNPDLAVADFCGDDPKSGFAGNSPGLVSILLGNGDGTFRPREDYATGIEPSAVAVGRFSDDGPMDLAVTSEFGATVSVLLNATGSG